MMEHAFEGMIIAETMNDSPGLPRPPPHFQGKEKNEAQQPGGHPRVGHWIEDYCRRRP